MEATKIYIETTVNAPKEVIWSRWTHPQDIIHWAFASEDWHAPYAENDVRKGGKFKTTMAAKDGSMQFDFEGTYTDVDHLKSIHYTLSDGRKVEIEIESEGDKTRLALVFEAEGANPVDMQQAGWQAILDNFKKYVEAHL